MSQPRIGLDFLWCYKCSRGFFAEVGPPGLKYGVPKGVTGASGDGSSGGYRGATGALGWPRAAASGLVAFKWSRRAQSWAPEAKNHTFIVFVRKFGNTHFP